MAIFLYLAVFVAASALVVLAYPRDVVRETAPVGLLAQKRKRVESSSLLFKVFGGLVRLGARYSGSRPWSPRLRRLEKDLLRAGSPGALTPDEYTAVMWIAAVIAFPVMLVLTNAFTGESSVTFSLLFSLVAYWLARRWIRDVGVKNVRTFNRLLPYSLDLLTLSMDAGLNFELALERLVEWGGEEDPVSREFGQLQAEVSLGRPRRDAIRSMANRVGSEDLDSVVLAIEQGEQLGVPLGESLASQAELIRLKRSQRAEKLAQEAGIKILFPTMFILFSVLLVLFGGTIVKAIRGEFW